MSKTKKFYGVLYIRGTRSEKCTSCGSPTTRLIGIGQMRVCTGCAVQVMSHINDAVNRHGDEARKDSAKQEVRDASVASDL